MSDSGADVRTAQLARLRGLSQQAPACDVLIIGGGATGLGIAVDAVTRGYSVVLLDANDFGKGTSSRSSKLVHGGVRYLAQGNISLVREALHERARLLANAPALAQRLGFVIPCYHWWEQPYYRLGMWAYDLLAGRSNIGRARNMSNDEALRMAPAIARTGLSGAVLYYDGQFDDARLCIALARTARAQGALLLNYCNVDDVWLQDGKVQGVHASDVATGERFALKAGCVINAAGAWAPAFAKRAASSGASAAKASQAIAASRGTHIVVRDLGFKEAVLIPKTSDGRVMFIIPWQGVTVLGTTDVACDSVPVDPLVPHEDVQQILDTASGYLQQPLTHADIQSAYVGYRPLVADDDEDKDNTAGLSREHEVRVSRSGLVSVLGGKWTTYRRMAEDALDTAIKRRVLPANGACRTADFKLATQPLLDGIWQRMPDASDSNAWQAIVRTAVNDEWAYTVEDVLARRTRLLFRNVAQARAAAPGVAAHMATALSWDTARTHAELARFEAVARCFDVNTVPQTQ
jgi:glycerol-3-phosphate dehydrogenase